MTDITPPPAWYATFVRRWHSGPSSPWLGHIGDTNGAHSGRMAATALAIWGNACSRELLVACIVHDLGEYAVADVPAPAKADPTLRSTLDRLETAALARMGLSYSLSLDDEARLQLLDRLDPYFIAQHFAPQIINRPDWRADRDRLDALADAASVDLHQWARE